MGTKLEYDEIVRILEGFVKDYEKSVKKIYDDDCSDMASIMWERGFLCATVKHLRDITLEIDELSDYYESTEERIEAVKKFIGID